MSHLTLRWTGRRKYQLRWRGIARSLTAPTAAQAAQAAPLTFVPIYIGGEGGGAAGYMHTQASAASTWTVNHNLGRKAPVSVLSPGGLEVDAAVHHVSDNQVVISFNQPYSGFALVG